MARADSPLKTLSDIKDKTISVGLLGSGTAQSATTLYRLMFGQAIPEQNVQHLSNEDALAALIAEKSGRRHHRRRAARETVQRHEPGTVAANPSAERPIPPRRNDRPREAEPISRRRSAQPAIRTG